MSSTLYEVALQKTSGSSRSLHSLQCTHLIPTTTPLVIKACLPLLTLPTIMTIINAKKCNSFNISLFYRTPSKPITPFLEEFRTFTSQHSASNIILGDFNIPMNLVNANSEILRKTLSCQFIFNKILERIYPNN